MLLFLLKINKMEIICVRHGESVGNVAFHKSYIENDHSHFTSEFQKIPSGDWVLTPEGESNSIKLGDYIRKNFGNIEYFFSSNVLRARQTAELLGLSKDWNYTPLLRERERGLTDNLSKNQWDDLSKKMHISFEEDSIDWRPPEGESAREMISRLNEFIKEISGYKRVLIVTHGELIQCLRFLIRNLPDEDYLEWIKNRGDVKNCQIYKFESNLDGGFIENTYILDNNI